eukprot:393424-Rhodomonas_salina.1
MLRGLRGRTPGPKRRRRPRRRRGGARCSEERPWRTNAVEAASGLQQANCARLGTYDYFLLYHSMIWGRRIGIFCYRILQLKGAFVVCYSIGVRRILQSFLR